MKNNIWKKELVLGIIVLFIGASVIPSMGRTVEEKQSSTDDRTPFMTFNHRGDTLYVGGSGPNNYTKIQDAIDNASDGDTVFVYDDSSPYYENVVVNKSINLIGENRDTTVIDAGGVGDVVFVYADYVNISEFTVTNSSELENGIFLNFADYCNISHNIISNNFKGLMLQHSENNTLTDNIVNSNNADGINLLDSSNNNTISNNTANSNGILEHWGGGIRLGAGGNPSRNVTDNIVTGNTASNNSDDGIGLEWSEENTVIGNIVDSNHAEGISLYHSNYSTVINNTALYNSRSGVGLHDSHNNIISWNNVSSNNLHGIYLFSFSSNNTISDNNIASNNGNGIGLSFSYFNVIKYNNFIRNFWQAGFIYDSFHGYFSNCWNENYWNRPRLLPKPIFGIMVIGFTPIFIPIPWLNFDWHPAQEPYDIP